jgi:hypothetical protein
VSESCTPYSARIDFFSSVDSATCVAPRNNQCRAAPDAE